MSCGVGRRHSSDLALLWLWCRPAATPRIGPLAWELPYAMGAALKKKKEKEKEKEKRKKIALSEGELKPTLKFHMLTLPAR